MVRYQYDPHRDEAEDCIKWIQQTSKKIFPYNDRKQPAYYYTVARLCYTLASLKAITNFNSRYDHELWQFMVQQQIKQYLNYQLPTKADHLISSTLSREYQLKLSILNELTQTPQGLKDAFIVTQQLMDK